MRALALAYERTPEARLYRPDFASCGHDTTATAAAWCLMLLAKHVEVQTKLRAEIRAIFVQ